jgi:aryl-alcohol dehydrogenase-like predicted oxidoreductase
MPTRAIPTTGEELPVIGLGSTKVIEEIPASGVQPVGEVIRTLTGHGGTVIDTWPVWPDNTDNQSSFGRVLSEPDLRDRVFLATKIDVTERSGIPVAGSGSEEGMAQFRETQRVYNRQRIDLLQLMNLDDPEIHWPNLRRLKDGGQARYIGVTIGGGGGEEARNQLERFARRERPDFVQLPYAVTRRDVEERLLPMMADLGIAVMINSPFMNGAYFRFLEGVPLPEWAQEFECESWAQFSLKYILANPYLTCVLTETSNPRNMDENARTAFGPLPDAAARQQMREFMDQIQL